MKQKITGARHGRLNPYPILWARLMAAALIAALSISTASAEVPSDEEDVYFILSGEADKAIAEGDYPTAALRIREAINTAPDNPQNVMLLSNLGIVYGCMEQDSLALEAFDRALAIAPAMTVIQENRGRLRLKMGDQAGAYADFSNVIERDSCNVTARYYHGLMSLFGGDMVAAERDFDVLADRDPDGYNTCVAMATLYSMTGRDHQAIPYYKRLIELEAEPEYYAQLAGCYLAEQELSEAAATIEAGLQAYPDDPELYYYRAWLNRDRYLLREAKADAAMAIALGADRKRVEALFEK